MLEAAILSVNLSTSQLCVESTITNEVVECHTVAHGCPNYPTPTGSFEVNKIYTNASLVSFKDGTNLGTNIIGGLLIDLGKSSVIPGARFALHGWHLPITPETCSHSCIRINTNVLKTIITSYSFQEVNISPR